MGLQTFGNDMPARQQPLIDLSTGSATRDLWYLLLAFFQRTGQGGGIPTIDTGLTAIIPTSGTMPLIAADWNEFTNVPAGSACQIPPVKVGSDFIVWNFGAFQLLVTPQPTYQIDALGNGVAYQLLSNKMQWFRCTELNQLRSMQLG